MTKQSKAAAAKAAAAIEAAAPAEPAAATIEMAGEPGMIVLVRGPEDGRRRGGLTFGPVEIEVDLGAIAKDDFAAIMADPHLKVRAKPADETPANAGDE